MGYALAQSSEPYFASKHNGPQKSNLKIPHVYDLEITGFQSRAVIS